MLKRHYDRSDVKKRKAEAVARTIGKNKKARIYFDLENVDEWSDESIKGKISAASIALKINSLKKS